MNSARYHEGPAVLQLHRWDRTRSQLDLSEFREAFISPTKELLLLLSYKFEAMLIPLSRGYSLGIGVGEGCKYEHQHTVDSLSSSVLTEQNRLISRGNIPSTSESVTAGSDIAEINGLQSNSYPFVCDVNSLAWGICGDTYDQHEEALYREFLFVCGNHGVTVHAFRQVDESCDGSESAVEGGNVHGKWVEWRSSDVSSCDSQIVGGVASLRTHDVGGSSLRLGNESSESMVQKMWLQSFLTQAETRCLDGTIRTFFPEKSVIPISAKVVSFHLFECSPCIVELLCRDKAVGGSYRTADSDLSNQDVSSDQSCLYQCSKVFSSNSNHLIGFVLCLVNDATNNSLDASLKRCNRVVLVARLDVCWIQWLCSVKIDHNTLSSESEWTDFQFYDNLLICLNAFGFIFFYGAVTGEYVMHLDVLWIYGFGPQRHLQEDNSVEVNLSTQNFTFQMEDTADCKLDSQAGGIVWKRRFQRLIVASCTSLLAMVDDCGVVYVMRLGDHVSENSFLSNKSLLPYLRFGVTGPWGFGYSDISFQKPFFTHPSSGSQASDTLSMASKNLFYMNDFSKAGFHNIENWSPRGLLKQDDFLLSGFSDLSQKNFQNFVPSGHSHLMRNLFLPIAKINPEDAICLSPLGIMRLVRMKSVDGKNSLHAVHTNFFVQPTFCGSKHETMGKESQDAVVGEGVGCLFQGCLYLVTGEGLSVILPRVSVSSDVHLNEHEPSCYDSPKMIYQASYAEGDMFRLIGVEQSSPWKVEILDRTLLFEGPDEADNLCLANGWDIKASRLRHLELALAYLKFVEMEQALEMLAGIHLAEEGILRMIFATVYVMIHRVGNDNKASAASKILTLASQFAIKTIREYATIEQKKSESTMRGWDRMKPGLKLPQLPYQQLVEAPYSRKLTEMAHYLEIIRKFQCRLDSKFKRPGLGLVDDGDVQTSMTKDDFQLSDATSLDKLNQLETSFSSVKLDCQTTPNLALMPSESLSSDDHLKLELRDDQSLLASDVSSRGKQFFVENPKEMIARWEIENLDLRTVVKDALLSGRLPLAVLQLHLHRLKDVVVDNESNDTFSEIRDIGRALAYDLFLKGEVGLAMSTLQRLGEDVEACLKQLVFGTVNRYLRKQITEETKKYGYLKSYELALLERISVIERLYPSCSFWKTYLFQQKEVMRCSVPVGSPSQNRLHLIHSHAFQDLVIDCGEVDGVVLGSWTNFEGSLFTSELDEDGSDAGYWAAAAVWANAWDQTTIDRILLDQPFFMGVHVMWESQLEYHICHNDWEETSKLLEMIPNSALSLQSLQVGFDLLQHASSIAHSKDFQIYDSYVYSPKELDISYTEIPGIRLLKSPVHGICSEWLRMVIEKELAKKLIFLKEHWYGTAEIIPIMAQSGIISEKKNILSQDEPVQGSSYVDAVHIEEELQLDAMQAFHKLVIRHCMLYNLPCFLDLYLDHHQLAHNRDTLNGLQDAAGDSQWANWMIFSRIKGQEYDASFSNARAILSREGTVNDCHVMMPHTTDFVHTVDNIAECGWLMAALATLMFAPLPIQHCLSSGSVKMRDSSSAQCTLENLRPALQRFPTLWRVLFAASLGQDTSDFLGPKVRNVHGSSVLSVHLNWRDSIFYSSGCDTSLLQMLPRWFPKPLRRLTQLFVQGPLRWQAMADPQSGMDFFIDDEEYSEISMVSWEAGIQKQIEQELYASSMKENGLGLEHHLHRGCALAAFNHFLGYRVQKLRSEDAIRGHSIASLREQANVQSDMQIMLAPLDQNEERLLSSVMPLAMTNYQNSLVVASCIFLLELCGLSASIIRVNVAALRRISHFYKSKENIVQDKPLANSVIEEATADSLAQALADYYIHKETRILEQDESSKSVNSKPSSLALLLVLQHLEKASLPVMTDGKTCGSWLVSGHGDGSELRSQQKTASQHWKLVTVFCQMHQIPLSTKYLASLARDNDWVGFLSEAQTGGYAFERVIQVATKEFSDPRLRTHILTVLGIIYSKKKVSSLPSADGSDNREEAHPANRSPCIPMELFGILAECETQKYPGKALLVKAKKLSWSLLAMIASCFADVSPFSCLTVWLEITASSDATSMKINDIASQLANTARAAVEAINSKPAVDRVQSVHYNRKNQKRQKLMDPATEDLSPATTSESSSVHLKSIIEEAKQVEATEHVEVSSELDDWSVSLPKMVALLCEQGHFLPLLRAFEMFLPSCSLLPFVRALQAFSQMRLSEAAAHLGSFSAQIREEPFLAFPRFPREGQPGVSWISSTARKAADSILSTCPSAYERRCLLELLVKTDFGDGGSSITFYKQKLWKINLAEPELCRDGGLQLGNEKLDDASLLAALETNGHWELAHNWAQQLETTEGQWKYAFHRVTETQAESMVAEWKEFLWDVPEERVALWGHCQTLFIRCSYPPLQAGLFFLKHAEAVEKDLPPRELHELLLLSLQWLSGMITQSNPVYPLHLLREIETRAWLLAVESEEVGKGERDFHLTSLMPENSPNIIDRTANVVMKMDDHINSTNRATEKADVKDSNSAHLKSSQAWDTGSKAKRRAKVSGSSRQSVMAAVDRSMDLEDNTSSPGNAPLNIRDELLDDNSRVEASFSRWEERIGPLELERAVLSLLEFGQLTAAKQLQHKLSPGNVPSEFKFVDAALKLAEFSTPLQEISISLMDEDLRSVIQPYHNLSDKQRVDPLQVLETLCTRFTEGSGRGFCKRIISVVKAANVLGILFSEAFSKKPTELLQLLSLKAQESYEEARLLVLTHSMPASSIAQILAESFLKGLLAAHRGGYIDCQKEEGPAPLLWRFSDFLKWAELCPSEPEIGHALMRLVITGQEIPHACEVELLILSHHFYKSSACLDGVDVLVALAATRVDAYVSEGDFLCLARLVTGVGNFQALNFILGILIENGQLDLLLHKYSAADDANNTADAFRGFRMAVLTSLMHFNPDDLDAFAMVYSHFDMKHETASLLQYRAEQAAQQWIILKDKYNNEDLLESMRYYIDAAEVHSTIDAGNKTRYAFAQASLVSLQIRMPDFVWLNLSETNARYALVAQSQFQEALIVAEAYKLNHPGEWALALWERMLKPELEQFVDEFVSVLPLQPPMLYDLAKFYRNEVAARGDQSQFPVWGTADWAKTLERSFRCLLKRTRDLRVRLQVATMATGFIDVIRACNNALDKVPESSGQIVLRKGHGGAYLPLM